MYHICLPYTLYALHIICQILNYQNLRTLLFNIKHFYRIKHTKLRFLFHTKHIEFLLSAGQCTHCLGIDKNQRVHPAFQKSQHTENSLAGITKLQGKLVSTRLSY